MDPLNNGKRRQKPAEDLAIVVAFAVGLILFLVLVPVVCSMRVNGGAVSQCSGVLVGWLEAAFGIEVPPVVSLGSLIVVPPAAGWLTWFLIRRTR